jgi:hypothetical protein
MEAIGTAAAITQLLDLSIKVSKAAKSVGQSFLDAPGELDRLTLKLDLLHSRIEQLCDLSKGLPVSDSFLLLPLEHQTIISTNLQTNLQALQLIQSLCNHHSGKAKTVATRLRWAMLDKKRADRILENVTKAESQLNIVLAILGVYGLSHFCFQILCRLLLPFLPYLLSGSQRPISIAGSFYSEFLTFV